MARRRMMIASAARCALSAVAMSILLSGCATSAPSEAGMAPLQKQVADRFTELGVSPKKSRCYASRLDDKLDDDRLAEVVRILEDAESGADVRASVTSGDGAVKSAFFAANVGCTLVG